MSNIEQLIETANQLSNTLSIMADNEKKYGFDLCHSIENLSYETHKVACDLRNLRYLLTGEVI